ncbi:MAG: S9 family peptidase [Acidobacteria bacterium]|nr:S9 family peptidase [Acidobacteriota bacterium]
MKRILFFFAIVAFCFAGISAQTFNFDTMVKQRRVGDPQLSPDGRTVAFTIGDVDKAANKSLTHIYTVSVDGGTPRQITKGDKSNSSPRWSPDGKKIAFTTGGQIWTMDPDGDDRKQITKISTGAGGPVWSPDGKWIAFSSEVYPECPDDKCNAAEDERVSNSKVKAIVTDRLLYRHWVEWRDRKRTHVFVVSSSGGVADDMTPDDFDSPPYAAATGGDYSFSPNSQEIAVLRNPDKIEAISTNSDIYLVRLPTYSRKPTAKQWADGDVKNITVANRGYDVSPMYTPDDKYILFRSQAREGFEADRWRVMRYDRASGETRELTVGFDQQADEVTLSPDGKTVYFTANTRGKEPIYSVPLEPDFRLRIATHVKMVRADGYFSGLSVTNDGRSFIALSSSMTRPAEIYRVSATGGEMTSLSNANQDLGLMKAEETEWRGALGAKVHGWIVKPKDFDSTKKYPMIVLIHGGPQGAWNDNWGYRWNPQIYANAGYVVFMPNPRGSTGYGQKFVDEISGDWGGKAYVDIMNGVAEVIKRPYVDKNRIGGAGASYGGYMVDWILGHNTDVRFKFKALVSHAGVYNLESMAGATEELWFVNWEFKGMPWQNRANYERWSPHRFAANFKTPTLVTAGELDYRVPVDQSYQLFTALQLNKVPSKLVVFPDEGHWILKPQNSELWHKTVLGWFDAQLR